MCDNKWYNEWQPVTTERQQMTTSGTTQDNEWQQVTTNDAMSDSKSVQVKESDFRFQNETKGQPDSWRFLFNFLCNV